jgi:hypothetical protein
LKVLQNINSAVGHERHSVGATISS